MTKDNYVKTVLMLVDESIGEWPPKNTQLGVLPKLVTGCSLITRS
jgi:hypothetical protein